MNLDDGPLHKLDDDLVLQYLLKADHPPWDQLRMHPGFTEKWVVFFLKRSRPVPRESVEDIYYNKLFRKHYQINLHLMRCKTAPPHVSVSLVHQVRWMDLFRSLRLGHLPGALRQKIEAQILEQIPRLTLGEKITLAKQSPRSMIRHMRAMEEPMVIRALLMNYFFTHDDALFMAEYPKSAPGALEELAKCKKWQRYKDVRLCLMRHQNTPKAMLWPLAKPMSNHDLQSLLRHPGLPLYNRRLIHRILEERFNAMTGAQSEEDSAEVDLGDVTNE